MAPSGPVTIQVGGVGGRNVAPLLDAMNVKFFTPGTSFNVLSRPDNPGCRTSLHLQDGRQLIDLHASEIDFSHYIGKYAHLSPP